VRRPLSVVVALGLSAALGAAMQRSADAQRIDPRRPATFVVGGPAGAAPMARVDAKRSGLTKDLLPASALVVAWRKVTGLTVDQPAIGDAGGALAVVSVHGDVTFLDDAGEERGAVSVAASHVGPAAMMSDGTVAFVTSTGDVVGVHRTTPHPRFVVRVGAGRSLRGAPVALDDGGIVVASGSEILVLDAEGNVRVRGTVPEPPAVPLLVGNGLILSIGARGAIYGFSPGHEPARLGSFDGPLDGGAVVIGDGKGVAAVVSGNLVEVDLTRGARTTRSVPTEGVYLGPPALHHRRQGVELLSALSRTPTRELVTSVDGSGEELSRAPIASYPPAPLPDGGAAPVEIPPHTGPLVDALGTVAFATTDGHIGVVSANGAVSVMPDVPCTRSVRSTGILGLTPSGPGAFTITCEGGTVVRIKGRPADAIAPAPSSSAAPTATPIH
jgi:hypothetical protein